MQSLCEFVRRERTPLFLLCRTTRTYSWLHNLHMFTNNGISINTAARRSGSALLKPSLTLARINTYKMLKCNVNCKILNVHLHKYIYFSIKKGKMENRLYLNGGLKIKKFMYFYVGMVSLKIL